MREKPLAPGFERLGIVELQDFHIRDYQARPLDDRKSPRQSGYITAGKYVFGDPGIGDARRSTAANRMQERDTVVGEKLGALVEEGFVKANSDMFKHADGHDPVELPCNVAIVEKLEFDVVPAALKRSAFGAAVLLLRQCDSGDPRSGDLGKIKRKTAPAAADVENRGAAAYP